MNGIFLSYRREDSSAYAGRLYDRLIDHFGADRVFMDIDTIRPGEDFREAIQTRCSSCEVLLAVIGRFWLTAADRSGRARLQDEADFVRLEISLALKGGLLVIPVLVGGAEMPESKDLPPDLADLAFRNAWEISDKRFRQDVGGLIEGIERQLQEPDKEAVARATDAEPSDSIAVKSKEVGSALEPVVETQVLGDRSVGAEPAPQERVGQVSRMRTWVGLTAGLLILGLLGLLFTIWVVARF